MSGGGAPQAASSSKTLSEAAAGHPPELPVWIDTHCHLQWATGGAEAAIERARAAGVIGMVCVGTDATSSREAVALAGRFPDVRATVGLHPHEASRLAEEWDELCELVTAPGVVGVGETGFDLHYTHSPVEAQAESFRRHVRLAEQAGHTLVIHARDAWDEVFGVLADEGSPERVVLHCFTGGPAEAARALGGGASISFSGIVSFANAHDVRAAAVTVPPDRLLVETDAPYLAPVPHRGRENEPAWVPVVGGALAGALGLPVAEVAAATTANARRLFGFPLTP